jgi:hypothetical protein
MDWKHLLIEWGPYIISAALPILADATLGLLPDKWVKYIGVTRRIIDATKKAKGVK